MLNPRSDSNFREKHGSLFLLGSHGPPRNASHGSAVLNLGGKSFRNKLHFEQPPRPLYLSSRPPSPIPQFTAYVKFAPEPQTRTAHSSSLRGPFGVRNQGSFFSEIVETTNQENCDFEEIDTSAVDSATIPRNTHTPLSDSTSTAHVLSFPNSSIPRTFIRASSSSPHLPLTQTRPETELQSHASEGNFRHSSFFPPTTPSQSEEEAAAPRPATYSDIGSIAPVTPKQINSFHTLVHPSVVLKVV
ncbi:hypothetical protein C0995_001902 [Termitomyces sp. Mi166|nr:hypothetical protein C0995_001902 [Termitomyces sp. Mi166\